MLTLLRKVRKSLIQAKSVRKYFLCASREIVLVIVGILIALQINNWNDERKAKDLLIIKQSSTLQDILSEMEENYDQVLLEL